MKARNALLLFTMSFAWAQPIPVGGSGAAVFQLGTEHLEVVVGAPFSAKRVRDNPESRGPTLSEDIFRDSQGRVRTDRHAPAAGTLVEILDPVSGESYAMVSGQKTIFRFPLKRYQPLTNLDRPPTRFPYVHLPMAVGAEGRLEWLGTKVINKVQVVGIRRTDKLSARGPSGTFVDWFSQDLGVRVLSEFGRSNERLTDLKLQEPPAKLFILPANYQIVDQQTPFQIGVGATPLRMPPTSSVSNLRIVTKRDPEYTDEARKAGLEGDVLLVTRVDTNGTAKVLRVAIPLDSGLDRKAIECVESWRFEPVKVQADSVPSDVFVVVGFRLNTSH